MEFNQSWINQVDAWHSHGNMDNSYSTAPSSSSTQACHCEEASSMKKKFLKAVKEQRSRLYIEYEQY
ncbi:hypothetical protein Lal_00006702 [Lupinus albus]|nr:hypothetical protein Lal_00006702 [Lupinus albus]